MPTSFGPPLNPPLGERFMSMFDDHDSEEQQAVPARGGGSRSDGSDASGSEDAHADSASGAASSDEEEEEGDHELGARRKEVDIVEHIFDNRRGPTGGKRGAGPAGGAGGGPGNPAAAAQAAQAAEVARLQQERKRFMSAKAAVLAGDGLQQAQAGRRRRSSAGGMPSVAGDSEGLSRDDFLQIQREVQLLGE